MYIFSKIEDLRLLLSVLNAALQETGLQDDALAFAAMSYHVTARMAGGEKDFEKLKKAAIRAVNEGDDTEGH